MYICTNIYGYIARFEHFLKCCLMRPTVTDMVLHPKPSTLNPKPYTLRPKA